MHTLAQSGNARSVLVMYPSKHRIRSCDKRTIPTIAHGEFFLFAHVICRHMYANVTGNSIRSDSASKYVKYIYYTTRTRTHVEQTSMRLCDT